MVRRPADLTLRVGVGMQAELTSGRIRFESATLLTYIKLIDFNPCCLDDSLPFFRIRAQKLRKLVWERAPDYVRIASQLLDERWFYESFGKITTYLLYNFSFVQFHSAFWLAQRRLATSQPHNLGHPTRRWSVHPVLLGIAWRLSRQGRGPGPTANR